MNNVKRYNRIRPERPCAYCGDLFIPKRITKLYCTDRCRYLSYLVRQDEVLLNSEQNESNDLGAPYQAIELETAINDLENENFPFYKEKKETLPETITQTQKETLNPTIRETLTQTSIQTLNPTLTKKEAAEEENEQPYIWVSSDFLDSIHLRFNEDNTAMLQNPDKYWREEAANNVNWVTIRVLSLLESLLKLSYYSSIDSESFSAITQAFCEVIGNEKFKYLPTNYPYQKQIEEIAYWLADANAKNKGISKIWFKISKERKISLIVIIHEIMQSGNYFPLKFSELQFVK